MVTGKKKIAVHLIYCSSFSLYCFNQPNVYFKRAKGSMCTVSTACSKTSQDDDDQPLIKRLQERNTSEEVNVKRKRVQFTDHTVDNKKGHFDVRLDCTKGHWPIISTTKNVPQYEVHIWARSLKNRKKGNVVLCEGCNVHLCCVCFKICC